MDLSFEGKERCSIQKHRATPHSSIAPTIRADLPSTASNANGSRPESYFYSANKHECHFSQPYPVFTTERQILQITGVIGETTC